jgi:hypothetical protein
MNRCGQIIFVNLRPIVQVRLHYHKFPTNLHPTKERIPMFDDFMQNDFSDLNLNQAHQDAMLHAQNQAMDQAMRAQQARQMADDSVQAIQHHGVLAEAPQPVLATGLGEAAVNLALLFQTALEKVFGWRQD